MEVGWCVQIGYVNRVKVFHTQTHAQIHEGRKERIVKHPTVDYYFNDGMYRLDNFVYLSLKTQNQNVFIGVSYVS